MIGISLISLISAITVVEFYFNFSHVLKLFVIGYYLAFYDKLLQDANPLAEE